MEPTAAGSTEPAQRGGSASLAWVAIICAPFGVVASVGVAYAIAALLGVTLDPANGPRLAAWQNAAIWTIAGVVMMAAPVGAILCALGPARAGSRSGLAALVVASLVLCGTLAITISSLVSW